MLGIDPGLQCTGWGLVARDGQLLRHLAHGTVRTNPENSDALRLQEIHDGLSGVIAKWHPHAAAIEAIFVARGAASAIKLGMARGVAMQVCSGGGLPLFEVAARQVKKAVTGTGKADKKQVQAMVDRLLAVRSSGVDAADALAIAITALNIGPAFVAGHSAQAGGRRPASQPVSGLSAAIEAALAKETQRGSQ